MTTKTAEHKSLKLPPLTCHDQALLYRIEKPCKPNPGPGERLAWNFVQEYFDFLRRRRKEVDDWLYEHVPDKRHLFTPSTRTIEAALAVIDKVLAADCTAPPTPKQCASDECSFKAGDLVQVISAKSKWNGWLGHVVKSERDPIEGRVYFVRILDRIATGEALPWFTAQELRRISLDDETTDCGAAPPPLDDDTGAG